MNAKDLLSIIKPLAPAVGNPILPICDYIRLHNSKAISTNLRMTITVPCKLPDMLLPYKETVAILSALGSADILIENKKGLLQIKSGKDVFKLGKTVDADTFPAIPENNGDEYAVSKDFFYAMQQSARNETTNELMVFHGICIRPDYVCGTDGHTCYRHAIETGIPESHLHSSIAAICASFEKGIVKTDGHHFSIKTDTIEIDVLQVDTKYPDIDLVVPSEIKPNVTISRIDIEQALTKVQVFEKGNIKLVFTAGAIDFVYINKEFERQIVTSIPAKHELELEYGLNSGLLSRILSCLPDSCDTIEMQVTGATKPMLIKYDTIKLLIMPVMLA